MKYLLLIISLIVCVLCSAQNQISNTYNGNNGSSGLSAYGMYTTANSGQATIGAEGNGDIYANLNLGTNISGTRRFWHISKRPSSANHNLQFYHYNGSSFNSPLFTFSTAGSLGIGIISPSEKLEVDGNIRINGSNYLGYFKSNLNTWAEITVENQSGPSDTPVKAHLKVQDNQVELGSRTSHAVHIGAGDDQSHLVIMPTGNIGVGTISPSSLLHVNTSDQNTDFSLTNTFGTTGRNRILLGIVDRTWQIENDGALDIFKIRDADANSDRFVIDYSGNVGIGTIAPDAKLTVKGDIHAQEVNVDLLGAVAPDFVFEEDYKLKSLEETEAYIQAHEHLPEIPSAAEMEANGLELKEMNLKLLQKVEELTLHLIEQNKELKKQENRIAELERKLNDK